MAAQTEHESLQRTNVIGLERYKNARLALDHTPSLPTNPCATPTKRQGQLIPREYHGSQTSAFGFMRPMKLHIVRRRPLG